MNYHAKCGSCIYLGRRGKRFNRRTRSRLCSFAQQPYGTNGSYSSRLVSNVGYMVPTCAAYAKRGRGLCFLPPLYSKALYYARERIWLHPIRLAMHEHRTSCIRTRPSRRFDAWLIADFWRFGKSEVGDTDGGKAVEALCDITWPGERK